MCGLEEAGPVRGLRDLQAQGPPGLTWNSSALTTSTWPSSHWCRRCAPALHTASWPCALLRITLSSPLSASGGQGRSGLLLAPALPATQALEAQLHSQKCSGKPTWYQNRRQEDSVAGRGWLRSQAARPPGPSTPVSKRTKWPGNERGQGSRPADGLESTPPTGVGARTGWARWPTVRWGVCLWHCVWLRGPFRISDPPASVPRVWSTGGWGYREGVAPLLQSQLNPPRLGQGRWLQPHRPASKSQEAARDLGRSAGLPPFPLSGPGPGQASWGWSGARARVGQGRCSHLAGGRARPGAAGRLVRCRTAPHQRRPPQIPPAWHGGVGGSRLRGPDRPRRGEGPLPPTLTLQALSACTSTLPRRQAKPPWALRLSTCCLPASSTWTCKVPAASTRPARSAAATRNSPSGAPGQLLPLLTWVSEAQVVPEGQAGGLGQRLVLL